MFVAFLSRKQSLEDLALTGRVKGRPFRESNINSTADFRNNCSLFDKSMKLGEDTHFDVVKKIGYGAS